MDETITLAENVSANIRYLRGLIVLSKFKIMLAFVGLVLITYFIQGAHPKLEDAGIFYLYIVESLVVLISIASLWNSYKVLLSSSRVVMLDLKHLESLITMTDRTIMVAQSKDVSQARLYSFKIRMSRISFS